MGEGQTEVAIIEKIETIKNSRYGIKAGSLYKLILIMPSCSKIKSASEVKLLPGAGTAKGFSQCAQIIEKDMKRLISKSDRPAAAETEPSCKKATEKETFGKEQFADETVADNKEIDKSTAEKEAPSKEKLSRPPAKNTKKHLPKKKKHLPKKTPSPAAAIEPSFKSAKKVELSNRSHVVKLHAFHAALQQEVDECNKNDAFLLFYSIPIAFMFLVF